MAKKKPAEEIEIIPETVPEEQLEAIQEEQTEPVNAALMIADIPESLLPPFDKMLGTLTPGFAEFVEKHDLTAEQEKALVLRLEKR